VPYDDALAGVGWQCWCGARGQRTVYCTACGRSRTPYVPSIWVPEPRHPRMGLTRRDKALATLIALVLFAGVNQLVLRTEAITARQRTAALNRTVAELSAFVAADHGGPFLRPVKATLLDDAAFVRQLFGDPSEDPPSEQDDADGSAEDGSGDWSATLVGLGLADPREDLAQTNGQLLADSTVGFYDQDAKELFVRGRALTPYVRMVLVHELTHAWQDQHYVLSGVDATALDDDAATAVTALVEGDASRVEVDWLGAQGDDVRKFVETYERSFDDDSEPTLAARSLDALESLPYAIGEHFVTALARYGGNRAVDEAFEHPPVSTAQVFDPALYLSHHRPAKPAEPKHDGTAIDSGRLGQLGLTVVLNGVREPGARDLSLAAGWDGDAYVTWRRGAAFCTALVVAAFSAEARDELRAGLREVSFTTRDVGRTGVEARRCAS
jgi:hypothetical protein